MRTVCVYAYIHNNFDRYMIQSPTCKHIKWAIAGRSESKLNTIRQELSISEKVPTYIADANNCESLNQCFGKAKLVLNCTGPYRFLGEPVVKACVESGSHYMDICGEPQFIEDMFLKYHDAACAANVLILHACAFDSVPADLGFLYTMRQYKDSALCSSVESFLSVKTGASGMAGHYTTYECAVHGMGDVASLHTIRKEAQSKYNPPKITFSGEKLERVGSVAYNDHVDEYIIPFMGADAAIVRSTARSVAMEKQNAGSESSAEFIWPQYAAYACIGDAWTNVATMSLYGMVYDMMLSMALV